MAVTRSGTLVKTSRRRRLSAMSRKNRSTMFSQDAEVGVKWSCPDFADTFSLEKESEMPTPKPPYPAAFRQQMVELVRAGRGVSDLAREFGCNASSIHAWVKAAGGLDGNGALSTDAPLSANERQELIELRRKFRQVQQERDILAKATAWFAAKSEKTPTSSTNS